VPKILHQCDCREKYAPRLRNYSRICCRGSHTYARLEITNDGSRIFFANAGDTLRQRVELSAFAADGGVKVKF
jgi:hypothetical protein